ncbi:MAG TPA: cysteine synthase A [Firmicutes bacterium]|nr:cysteine synthase A [Bacillota bacterium]
MAYFKSISDMVGGTPLLELSRFDAERALAGRIFAKLEKNNPAGSAKDRVAKYMIAAAEKEGKLAAGGTIVEPTSGNTGIGLAAIARAKGYRVILTMPSTMSAERRKLLEAYGAEVVLTDGAKGMSGAIEEADRLASSIAGAFVPGQFSNPANPLAHYETTGPEIFEALGGKVDAFVASVGTGGTLTGVARYLRERLPDVYVVAVEPAGSPVLSGGKAGPHAIQGIGAGFVPKILDTSLYQEVITVSDDDAFSYARAVGKAEGTLVGISSGAALCAAAQLAARAQFAGKNIVVVFPDGADRYLSTKLFA